LCFVRLVRFEELTDNQWNLLLPSIPPPSYTGRPRADDRSIVNGILYVLMSGYRWMDMPSKYGSYKTAWERHKKWSIKGVWKNIMNSLISRGYNSGLISIDDLSVDSSTVPSKKGGKK
jgi:transposase